MWNFQKSGLEIFLMFVYVFVCATGRKINHLYSENGLSYQAKILRARGADYTLSLWQIWLALVLFLIFYDFFFNNTNLTLSLQTWVILGTNEKRAVFGYSTWKI